MKTRYLILLLIPLILLAWALLRVSPAHRADQSVSSPVLDPAVQQAVEAFGATLQKVSLLAPAADLKAAIEREYAPFVSAQLRAQWETNPENALGRTTSSPWPDRIQVHSTEPQADGSYLVRGVVIEVANDAVGTPDVAATYPVTFRMDKTGDTWLITSAQKGDYSEIPHRQEIIGTYTCLPHRDQSGPQTMECAFGLKEDGSGDYYSLNTQLMSNDIAMRLPTGSHIRVQGVMMPVNQLNTDAWQKYDIVGIINATSIEQI